VKLSEVLHDKKKLAWAAVGTGAVVGGFVWLRRRAAGGASGGGGSSSSSGGGIANPAYANTTGTDMANWVGGTLGGFSDQMAAYQKQLTDQLTQLQQVGGNNNSGGGNTGITNNDQWAAAAFKWLNDRTGWSRIDPLTAQIAIRDYLAGKPLGDWEKWTIDPILGGGQVNLAKFPWQKDWGAGIGPPPVLPGSN